jgi:hypothetical protein
MPMNKTIGTIVINEREINSTHVCWDPYKFNILFMFLQCQYFFFYFEDIQGGPKRIYVFQTYIFSKLSIVAVCCGYRRNKCIV